MLRSRFGGYRPYIQCVGSVLVVGCALLGAPATPAYAEVSAECWEHLAGVKESNTPAADRRYHLERGEHSPCTEQDASQGNRNNSGRRVDSTQGSDYNDKGNERKSKYCRKRWFC